MAEPQPKKFEPDKLYKIGVSEPIEPFPGFVIRPREGGTLKGEVAEKFADKITTFEVAPE